jgi:hypothetical protein
MYSVFGTHFPVLTGNFGSVQGQTARNRLPAWAEAISSNRFLGFFNVFKNSGLFALDPQQVLI